MSTYTGERALTPSELNFLLQSLIDSVEVFQNIKLTGQLTNLRYYQAGSMLYFTLFDGQSKVNCVIYKDALQKLKHEPKEGQEATVIGTCKWQAKRGQLIFQSVTILPKGLGKPQQEYEKLRKKLHAEGLFDDKHKKPFPKFPNHIALITAEDSAAFWDALRVCHKDYPGLKISLIPATMQGENTSPSIIKAISILNQKKTINGAIILRGGGSQEDLAWFNDENIVRKVAACNTPIISAIGHEIDFTLLDFVADVRAATPTEAAKIVTRSIREFRQSLPHTLTYLHQQLGASLSLSKNQLLQLEKSRKNQAAQTIKTTIEKLKHLHHRMALANPLFKLKQGFSICRDTNTHSIIKTLKGIKLKQDVTIQVNEGQFDAQVTKIKKEQKKNKTT